MAGAAVFSLAMAAIGLLVFGERMGLPAPLAALGVIGVLFAALIAAALLGATSRLGHYVVSRERGGVFAYGAVSGALLVLGYYHVRGLGDGGGSAWISPALLWLLGGFCAGQIVLPANPWKAFQPTIGVTPGQAGTGGDALGGAVTMMMLAGTIGTLSVLISILPDLASRLVAASGWSKEIVSRSLLGLVCALALFGGLVSIRHAVMIGFALTGLLLVLPVFVEWFGIHLSQGSAEGAVRQMVPRAMTDLTSVVVVALQAPALSAALAGFLLGMAASPAAAAVTHPGTRWLAAMGGIGVATFVIASVEITGVRLQALMTTSLVGSPPVQWPVFVYDDVLRGWLSACGTLPDDARQAARACGTMDPRIVLPPGSLRFDEGLGMAALAASSGLPVILGFLWSLLPLVLALVACALLLLVAATGFAETAFGARARRKSLRSSRLGRIRLVILGICAALAVVEPVAGMAGGDLLRWGMLGSFFLASAAALAGWLLRAIRMVRRWRVAKAPPQPDVQACAG